jgi:tetratricopeptide (TPR) repeat protein
MNLINKTIYCFSFLMVFVLSGCSTVKEIFSKGQEELKLANEAYANGNNLEALIHATNAIIIDPEFITAKEFVRDHFDNSLRQAQNRLNRIAEPANTALAEEKFRILNNLTRLYENLQKSGLPYKHPKNQWIWTTAIIDYNPQRAEARDEAFQFLMTDGRALVARNRVKEAEAVFQKVVNQYTRNENHQLQVRQTIVDEVSFHASRMLNTNVLEEAIIAHEFFRTATVFLANDEEAKAGITNSAIYISYLYLEQAQQQEDANEPEMLKAAHNSYKSAVSWDATNDLAIEGKHRVTGKLAEYYYLNAVKAEYVRDFDKAIAMYSQVREWIPDYKNSMPQLYTLRINAKVNQIRRSLDEIVSLADTTILKVQQTTLVVDKTSLMLEKLATLSLSSINLNKQMLNVTALLEIYQGIPAVTPVTDKLSLDLKESRLAVNDMAAFFSGHNIPVLIPAITALDNNKAFVDDLKSRSPEMMLVFRQAIAATGNIEACMAEIRDEEKFKNLELLTDSVILSLNLTIRSIRIINTQLDEVEKHALALEVLSPAIDQLAPDVERLNATVATINPAISSLKAVLDRTYNLAGYKMTGRKFLTSPPIPIRIVQEEYSKMVMSQLNPELRKLEAIKLPQVRGFDKLSPQINQLTDRRALLENTAILMRLQWNDFRLSEQNIKSALIRLRTDFGCKTE